jgi:hypothetical protein
MTLFQLVRSDDAKKPPHPRSKGTSNLQPFTFPLKTTNLTLNSAAHLPLAKRYSSEKNELALLEVQRDLSANGPHRP